MRFGSYLTFAAALSFALCIMCGGRVNSQVAAGVKARTGNRLVPRQSIQLRLLTLRRPRPISSCEDVHKRCSMEAPVSLVLIRASGMLEWAAFSTRFS